MILPKSSFFRVQWPNPSASSSLQLHPACLVQVVPKACHVHANSFNACQVQADALSRGNEAAVLTWCGSISLLPGEISKEEKPILPVHPHLKQVPANAGSPNPFLIRVKHQYHYKKQHPEAAGGIRAQFPPQTLKAHLTCIISSSCLTK